MRDCLGIGYIDKGYLCAQRYAVTFAYQNSSPVFFGHESVPDIHQFLELCGIVIWSHPEQVKIEWKVGNWSFHSSYF